MRQIVGTAVRISWFCGFWNGGSARLCRNNDRPRPTRGLVVAHLFRTLLVGFRSRIIALACV